MRPVSLVVLVVTTLCGCSEPPCAPGERKVGTVCVDLPEQPVRDADAGRNNDSGDSTGDSNGWLDGATPVATVDSGPRVPAEPGQVAASAIIAGCPLAGHCASWRVPDVFGKFAPAYVRENGVVQDVVTGLVWQDTVTFRGPYVEADGYCHNLALDGQDDWRLPTSIEITSIFSATSSSPSLDRDGFPDEMLDQDIWATKVESNGQVFIYTVYTGGMGTALKWHLESASEIVSSARCVRGGQAPTGPRYTIDAQEGTVVDNWTKLTWRRREEDGTFSWEEAQRRCGKLGSAWRLPTSKELVTLVDPVAVDPAIDVKAFPGTTPGTFWSTTEVSRLQNSKLERTRRAVSFELISVYSSFSLGGPPAEASKSFHVRCVR